MKLGQGNLEVIPVNQELAVPNRIISRISEWEKKGGKDIVMKGVDQNWKSQKAKEFLVKNRKIVEVKSSGKLMDIFEQELIKEIQDDIVEQVEEREVMHWNPSFIRPKSNGKFRKIIDFRGINSATNRIHFKMEDVKYVLDLLEVVNYATVLDLQGEYHHIRVEPELNKYFGFRFRNRDYVCRGLPFGYIQSPPLLCRILRKAINSIREKFNIRIIMYMDDLLLIGKSKQKLEQDTIQAVEMLEKLGWRISGSKCQMNPKTNFEFLGWAWETQNLTVRMPVKRRKEMQKKISCWIRWMQCRRSLPIREIAALQGDLNFLRVQMEDASLHLQSINKMKTEALKMKGGNG
ncbi:MAG: putative Transposon Ty3-G Gag-Pol polyprotein, partial [Streblomastix strix]